MQTHEGLQCPIAIRFRNSGPGIRDHEHRTSGCRANFDANRASGRHILQCVFQQVREHLRQQLALPRDQNLATDMQLGLDPAFLKAGRVELEHFACHVRQVHLFLFS